MPVPPTARCGTCDGLPESDGDTCTYDYAELDPLAAIVSATGEVAALYMHKTYTGSVVADCGGPFCWWAPVSASVSADLYIATPLGRPTLVLADSAHFTEGQVEIDPLGRIHIAAYEIDVSSGGLLGRYLRLDPLD